MVSHRPNRPDASDQTLTAVVDLRCVAAGAAGNVSPDVTFTKLLPAVARYGINGLCLQPHGPQWCTDALTTTPRTVDSEGHTPLGAAVLYTLASGNAGFMEYLLASTDVDALVGVSVL